MKKINYISVFLVIIFAAITVSAASMIKSMDESRELERLSRGGYSENIVEFEIGTTSHGFDDAKNVLRESDIENALLGYDNEMTKSRTVYIKGEYTKFPITKGRAFESTDFEGESIASVALVGENRISEIYSEDGKEMVNIGSTKAEVIGVVGYEMESEIDNLILTNAWEKEAGGLNNRYIMDIYTKDGKRNEKICDNAFLSLNKQAKNVNMKLERTKVLSSGIGRITGDQIRTVFIYLGLILLYSLCTVAVSLEWVSRQRRVIAVKRMIGVSNRVLIREVYTKYIALDIIGFALGIAASLIFVSTVGSIANIVVLFLINMIFGILITTVPVFDMMKVSVHEMVRY